MITIYIKEYPWTLTVEDTPAPNGQIRKLSNSQMLLSFLLVALWNTAKMSQAEQLRWLRGFVPAWSRMPNNELLCALETISRTQLDRYLDMLNEATLILPDGSTSSHSFGRYVKENQDSARKYFTILPLVGKGISNFEWMERALGKGVPVVWPKVEKPSEAKDFLQPYEGTAVPAGGDLTEANEGFVTPFERVKRMLAPLFKRKSIPA